MRVALLVLVAACNEWWPCPDLQPLNHQPCTIYPDRAGDFCEYGGDDHGQCRTTADCAEAPGSTTQAIWYVTKPSSTCGTNGASCPAAFGENEGAACTTSDTCEYAQGMCACLSCYNGTGMAGGYWHCRAWSEVGGGCPRDRPHPGDTCDVDGTYCDYDQCCGGPSFGTSLACKSGIWQQMLSGACICVTPNCP